MSKLLVTYGIGIFTVDNPPLIANTPYIYFSQFGIWDVWEGL